MQACVCALKISKRKQVNIYVDKTKPKNNVNCNDSDEWDDLWCDGRLRSGGGFWDDRDRLGMDRRWMTVLWKEWQR